MSKVFVITAGTYSDYHICGVALDREKAEKIANKMRADVEEFETEESEEALRWKHLYCCAKYADNTIEPKVVDMDVYQDWVNAVFERLEYTVTYVYANTAEEAIKKASDNFAKHYAEKQGL